MPHEAAAWVPWKPPRDLSTVEGRRQYASDCAAVQALLRGEAEPHQQKRVMEMLIYQLAGTYDMEFRPGSSEVDGRRASDFAAGRRWVGLQLVLMQQVKPSSLVGLTPTEQP